MRAYLSIRKFENGLLKKYPKHLIHCLDCFRHDYGSIGIFYWLGHLEGIVFWVIVGFLVLIFIAVLICVWQNKKNKKGLLYMKQEKKKKKKSKMKKEKKKNKKKKRMAMTKMTMTMKRIKRRIR